MNKGKDSLSKKIISLSDGSVLGYVKDIVFDAKKAKVIGFLVKEKGMMSNATILPFEKVKRVGADAVTVEGGDAVAEVSKTEEDQAALHKDNIVIGIRVMTEDGKDLGTISDIYYDSMGGDILGYEISGGMFSDVSTGKSFLPSPKVFRIGEDVAIVPADTAALMEEQVGGVRGAMRDASKTMRKKADAAKESASGAYASAKGALASRSSGPLLEEAIGRRALSSVQDADGWYIVAIGQIIGENEIAIARERGKEAELLESAGLTRSGAASSRIRRGARSVEGAFSGMDASWMQAKAGHAWEKTKGAVMDASKSVQGNIEERRIRSAIGRPVSRVILDSDDNAILATGDLITHDSVRAAREAGVLDMLLDSAADAEPEFSSDELKRKGSEAKDDKF